jgi:hypothetical protein
MFSSEFGTLSVNNPALLVFLLLYEFSLASVPNYHKQMCFLIVCDLEVHHGFLLQALGAGLLSSPFHLLEVTLSPWLMDFPPSAKPASAGRGLSHPSQHVTLT